MKPQASFDPEPPPRQLGPLALLSDLGAAMSAALPRFSSGLVGPDDPRHSIGIDGLLDQSMLASLMARARLVARDPDPRAVVSVWALSYFMTVLPPLVSAITLLDRAPHTALDRVRFVLTADAQIAALKVAAERPATTGAHYEHLVSAHLSGFVDHIAARSDVTARVLWSNAGHVLEAFTTMMEAAAPGRAGTAAARRLLASPTLSSGGRNPLLDPVRYTDGKRIRRVCCLRFLVPEWKLCAICPLPDGNAARHRTALSAG